jgi:MFS family permease
MVLGMAIMAVRQVANAVFVTPSFLIAFSLLQGAGYGLLLIGGITFVSRQAPRGTAATAQGILAGVTYSLSVIVGSGLGGLLAGWLTIRGLFAISACLGLAAIFLIALAVLPAARRSTPEAPSTSSPTLADRLEAHEQT